MLRLLTSDLVLDEPDDFGLSDLPALCRLVNWAGMLGCRVLLSSATLQPALLNALFAAYQAGRAHFHKGCGEPGPCPHLLRLVPMEGLGGRAGVGRQVPSGFIIRSLSPLDWPGWPSNPPCVEGRSAPVTAKGTSRDEVVQAGGEHGS